MLGWLLCSDAISARSDEPQGGLTKPGRDGTMQCAVQRQSQRTSEGSASRPSVEAQRCTVGSPPRLSRIE